MIIIKCCANCKYDDDNTCTVDCHCTTADDWCPRWEEEDNGRTDDIVRHYSLIYGIRLKVQTKENDR